MRQKAGQYWQNKQCFIFTNEIGKPFVHETVRVHFKKALKRAGLPETIRFHDLRHTFAALSLSLGDDVKTVQEHLGHQSAAFTMNTYIHMTNSMQEASAERLNLFFESIDKQKQ